MLFVTGRGNYTLTIQTDRTQVMQVDGLMQRVEVRPLLEAIFTQGCVMTPAERRAGIAAIKARYGNHGFGARAYTSAGVVDSAEGAGVGGKTFQPSDDQFWLSGFRTDDPKQCPPEEREKYEARLLDQPLGFNTDWFLVEAGGIQKPWPSYDETHHNKIAPTVKELGLDPQVVLEYEQATKNRPGVVEQLAAAVAERAEREFEERPLEVTIP